MKPIRIIISMLAALCALGVAAPSAVASTESLTNDYYSASAIVGSDACTPRARTSTGVGTLTGYRSNIGRGVKTERYDKGWYVPTGFKGRIYVDGTWTVTVPGPWTQCNSGHNIRIYVIT
jgi:hypothetical protein